MEKGREEKRRGKTIDTHAIARKNRGGGESIRDVDYTQAKLVMVPLPPPPPRSPGPHLFEVNSARNTGCPLADESVSPTIAKIKLCRLSTHSPTRKLPLPRYFDEPQFSLVNLDTTNSFDIFSNASY